MEIDFKFGSAITIARKAHEGQTRRHTNEPYLVHVFAVAGLVAAITDDSDMIVASILHDTVEDSDISIDLIRGVLGQRIASMVGCLTNISEPEDGIRAVRKKLDLEHIATASPEAKTIKLADIIDNIKSIVPCDPEFAKVYLEEKRQSLLVLREGDPTLFKIAEDIILDYFKGK